jgi:hypothetical protein
LFISRSKEIMSFSVHRLIVIGSAVLTAGLFTPVAAAQKGRSMGFGSMQSMRPSGMMGMPSMGRNTFMGGVGMNPNVNMMMGMGRYSASPYSMSAASQGGNSGMSSGGGYGSQSRPMSAPNQPNGSGDGYAPTSSSAGAGSSQPTAERNQLMTLRLFAGGLAWPVALRYLTGDGSWKELREGIDEQVEGLLMRQDGQPVPADLLERLTGDVDKLRKHLERQSYDMPTTSQQNTDARRFLAKLRSAVGQFPIITAASASPR